MATQQTAFVWRSGIGSPESESLEMECGAVATDVSWSGIAFIICGLSAEPTQSVDGPSRDETPP
jgi:hypothetical protein